MNKLDEDIGKNVSVILDQSGVHSTSCIIASLNSIALGKGVSGL